jgi:hypothetical protein
MVDKESAADNIKNWDRLPSDAGLRERRNYFTRSRKVTLMGRILDELTLAPRFFPGIGNLVFDKNK